MRCEPNITNTALQLCDRFDATHFFPHKSLGARCARLGAKKWLDRPPVKELDCGEMDVRGGGERRAAGPISFSVAANSFLISEQFLQQ
jgi:hypothetical protein